MKVLLALLMVLFPVLANAQQACVKDLTELDKALSEGEYKEVAAYGAFTAANKGLIIYKGPKTWTAVVIQEDGTACMVASGTKWHTLPKNKPASNTPPAATENLGKP